MFEACLIMKKKKRSIPVAQKEKMFYLHGARSSLYGKVF